MRTRLPSATATSRAPNRSTRRRVAHQRGAVTTARRPRTASAVIPIGATRGEVPTTGTNGAPSVTSVTSAGGCARVSHANPSPSAVSSQTRTRRPIPDSAPRPRTPGPRDDDRDGTADGRADGRAGRTPTPRARTAAYRIRPAATLNQKIARQPDHARITAPSTGPSTEPSSCTAPTTPKGVPRRSAGHRSATSASVAGTSPPPPIPWSTRPPTSTPRSVASAVTADPATKTTRQPRSTRRRSRRSERRPMSGSTAMYPRRKPEMIGVARWRASTPMPTPAIMSVRARTTT